MQHEIQHEIGKHFIKPIVAIVDTGVHFMPWGQVKKDFLPIGPPNQEIPQDAHGTNVAQILHGTNPLVQILDFKLNINKSIYDALKDIEAWEVKNTKKVMF